MSYRGKGDDIYVDDDYDKYGCHDNGYDDDVPRPGDHIRETWWPSG